MNTQKRAKPKRLLSLLLTVVMLLGVLPLSAVPVSAAGSVTGSGTDADPYVVTDYDGLQDVLINRGGSQTTYLKLGADFDTKSMNDGVGLTKSLMVKNRFVLDLNGHTMKLYTKVSVSALIYIYLGDLTVRDSGVGETGAIEGTIDLRSGGNSLVSVNGGNFTVESGKLSLKTGFNREDNYTVYHINGNMNINGGKIAEANKYGPSVFVSGSGAKAVINGGVIGLFYVELTKLMSTQEESVYVTVNGGNIGYMQFNAQGCVDKNDRYDGVRINGGVFDKKIEIEIYSKSSGYSTDWSTAYPIKKDIVEKLFPVGRLIIFKDKDDATHYVIGGLSDNTEMDICKLQWQRTDMFGGYGGAANGFVVTDNYIGIRNVTLNGTSVQYTHNSPYAPVYDVKRSEANTLAFSWYDLPEEMKSAGYSYSYSYRLYRNNIQTVTGGTVTPTTADGVSTWTHTVPADSAMNSYVVYLRLDLMKDGALVNTAGHDEYIVRLSGTDNIVSIAETALNLPNGDLRPDHYYGKPRESNTASVSGGVKYTVSSQTNWAGTLADDYHFKAGEAYTKTVVLKANTGYQFTASCAATLIGAPSAKITSATVSADKKSLTVQIQATCVTVLRTASGTLTGFYQGMNVWDAKVISAEPEKYDIEIVYIGDKYLDGTMTEPTLFQKDRDYAFGLKVVPKPGYGFLETGYGTVNLTVKMDDNYRSDIQTVTTQYTDYRQIGSMSYSGKFFETKEQCWAPPQTFDRVNVSIKVPVAGESADDIAYKKAFVDQPGFTVTDFYWKKKGSSGKFTGTFEAGKEYQYYITVKWQEYMRPVMDGEIPLYINGEDNNDWLEYDANNNVVAISGCDWMTATGTAPSPGYTVYGAATSFGSGADDVTIQLIESGASEAAYEAVVQGNSIGYAIENVVPGTYTMKVMKQNHVTREYAVTVGTENLKQDVKIHLLGDINGDGKVNTSDVNRANYQAKGKTALGAYEYACADVNGDGRVNTSDVNKMNYHAKGKSLLW